MKLKKYLGLLVLFLGNGAQAQEQFPMSELSFADLSPFQTTQSNWQIVGAVSAPMDKDQTLNTKKGSGILANLPDDNHKAQIFTQFEHGDIDLDFEVMMPVGSNSGVYLQGRYEIQLRDSWGKRRPNFADLGGIYQRWDDTQPKGQEGFEGTAPSTNAAKAPGLWQRLRISFQAPRFDAQGKKTKNARIIFVELNGVVIHQNVELTGPTRGPYVGGGDEAAMGPLVFQGDHGPVAFRNFKYRSFDGTPVQLKDLTYQVVRENIQETKDWSSVKGESKGTDQLITWNVAQTSNDFAIIYEGIFEIPQSGNYLFILACQGNASLWINGEMIINDMYSRTERHLASLTKGSVPFRLVYDKVEVWRQAQLGFSVEGGNFRPVNLHYESSALRSNPTDPIFERSGNQARLLRSFVDFKMPQMEQSKKITNAINVGDPTGLHYTYDLKQASIVQVWRGDFLNMTPMWYNRGNGVSRAIGVVEPLTPDIQLTQRQSDGSLSGQFADGQYRYRSYKVDDDNRPTFHYQAYGLDVVDQITPTSDRKSIERQLAFSGQAKGDLVFCLASGASLGKIKEELYIIDDRYYIQTSAKTKVEDLGDGRQALIVAVEDGKTISYRIIW